MYRFKGASFNDLIVESNNFLRPVLNLGISTYPLPRARNKILNIFSFFCYLFKFSEVIILTSNYHLHKLLGVKKLLER